jgi:hypothetical protein
MDQHQVPVVGMAEQLAPVGSVDQEPMPGPPVADGWLLLGAHLL